MNSLTLTCILDADRFFQVLQYASLEQYLLGLENIFQMPSNLVELNQKLIFQKLPEKDGSLVISSPYDFSTCLRLRSLRSTALFSLAIH